MLIFLVLHIGNSITTVLVYEGSEIKETKKVCLFVSFVVQRSSSPERHSG